MVRRLAFKKQTFELGALIACLGLSIASCSSNSDSRVSYRLLHPELHMGEYLQIANEPWIITVSRTGTQKGLIRVHTKTEEIQVLDAEGADARDIFSSSDKILYRLGTEIYFLSTSRVKIIDDAKELETFQWFGDFGRLFWETKDLEHRWLTFDSTGHILATGLALGTARDSFKKESEHWVLSQTPRGLFLSLFRAPLETVQRQIHVTSDPASGLYARARIIDDSLWIAHMHEEEGALSISKVLVSSLKDEKPSWVTERVDGEPQKVYRGLDIAIASFKGKPLLYYLDGWALRLREARLTSKGWVSREVPISGALGFYTQIVSESEHSITVATHNFRTSLDGTRQSYEDLMLFTLEPRVGD